MASGAGRAPADSIAVSVHGPAGVLDLVVPGGASANDVAREYAEQSGLPSIPLLFDRIGVPLLADRALTEAGVRSGAVLVATTSVHTTTPVPSTREPLMARSTSDPGRLSALWCGVSAGVAVVAGWLAARSEDQDLRTTAIGLLVAAAAVGVAPVGRLAPFRALAAPAFGAAAAFATAYDPEPERLPMLMGVTALGGAVTAALARSLSERVEEGLRVWMVAGASVFALTGLTTLLGQSATVAWSLLLVATTLAPRFVPGFSVDVPDQLLVDLERLAVTAWSARDRPRGRRGRVVASHEAVARVAREGTRVVTAAGVAIAVVATLASGLLLAGAPTDIDRIGARCLVLFAGAALLLAARSYRHTAPRAMLRVAGLACWMQLTADLLLGRGDAWPAVVGGVAIGVAGALVVAAVATGRGWRSVWWSRRAEVAEGLCGAAALASVLVATGLFRTVWELGSRVAQ